MVARTRCSFVNNGNGTRPLCGDRRGRRVAEVGNLAVFWSRLLFRTNPAVSPHSDGRHPGNSFSCCAGAQHCCCHPSHESKQPRDAPTHRTSPKISPIMREGVLGHLVEQ